MCKHLLLGLSVVKDVAGLDVPVNDVVGVDIPQGQEQRFHVVAGLRDR